MHDSGYIIIIDCNNKSAGMRVDSDTHMNIRHWSKTPSI